METLLSTRGFCLDVKTTGHGNQQLLQFAVCVRPPDTSWGNCVDKVNALKGLKTGFPSVHDAQHAGCVGNCLNSNNLRIAPVAYFSHFRTPLQFSSLRQ